MPDLFNQNSLTDVIGRMAEGKRAGGQGPPQAFGQAAAPGATSEAPAAADQEQENPWDQYQEPDPSELDPTGIHSLQQAKLATLSSFASNPQSQHGMGPSTSEALALHGDRIRVEAENFERRKRENAENWDRYMRSIELAIKLQQLGLEPESESGFKRSIEEDEKKKKQGTTPSGYNPNTGQPPNQPQGQQNATPSGFGMARF
jgi:hypothetical protein